MEKLRRTHKERTELSEAKMLEACASLILEVGTQNTTLRQVGERAGYSRGLANSRFGNKENLFLRVLEMCRERWFEESRTASAGTKGMKALEARIEAAANFSYKYPDDAKVMYILWFESIGSSSDIKTDLAEFHTNARKDVTAVVDEAKAMGEVSQLIDSKTFSIHFTSMIFGLAYQYVVSLEDVDFPELMKTLKTNAFRVLEYQV